MIIIIITNHQNSSLSSRGGNILISLLYTKPEPLPHHLEKPIDFCLAVIADPSTNSLQSYLYEIDLCIAN